MGLGNFGGFTYYDERPQLRQQRPVRHVHDRVARSADGHVHDQRGRHLVRRHADRRRRPAPARGRRRATCSTSRHDRHVDGTTAQADAEGNPIIVDPDGATRADRRPPPFDPETGRAARGLHLQGDDRRQLRRGQRVARSSSPSSRSLRGRPLDRRRRGTASTSTTSSRRLRRRAGAHRRREGARHRRSRRGQAGDHRCDQHDFTTGPPRRVKAISEFWNTGFDSTACPTTRAST